MASIEVDLSLSQEKKNHDAPHDSLQHEMQMAASKPVQITPGHHQNQAQYWDSYSHHHKLEDFPKLGGMSSTASLLCWRWGM
jgi:hypothetical protein